MNDVTRLSRHLLNRAASNRTIPKQECMVLLANLDLVLCSEIMETVSISGQYRIQDKANTTILQQYKKRPTALYHLSLDQYFHCKKNRDDGRNKKTIIPHYVGGRSQPTYPATDGYARATLIIHKPWTVDSEPYDKEEKVVATFEKFLKTPVCPLSVKLSYERMRWRYLEKLCGREAVAKEMQTSSLEGVDKDIIDILEIAATLNAPDGFDDLDEYNFDRGLDFDWSDEKINVSVTQDLTAIIKRQCHLY